MSLPIVLIVLLAAILHASWNAMLHAGADRLWSMTIMAIAIGLMGAVLAPFVALPAPPSWRFLAFSALLQVGYSLFLVRAYRNGDFGQVYPIARGSSPLLVSLGAALFASESPDAISMVGIALVSGGIISLAFQGRSLGVESLFYALGTGCFIGAYSVTDGIGVRLSGTPMGYSIWLFLLWGIMMAATYAIARDWRSLVRNPRDTCIAAAGGIVSLLAYGIVIFAMALSPMGPVSALRETSVVFAALIGRFALHERLTTYRIIACTIVAIGALCISHGTIK